MATKKPSKANPALARLLSGSTGVENKVNPVDSQPPLRTTTVVTNPEISNPTITTAESNYSTCFEKHASFREEKRDTAFLYTTLRKRLKTLAEAENSTINDLLNNIVEQWMTENNSDIKKSLKKLSNW